jgi:hypothetical protein
MEEIQAILNSGFTAYLGLAFILYALREATGISNKFIPVVAIVLGVSYSMLNVGLFNSDVLLDGLQNALLGVGSVAIIKYAINKTQSDK